jgi:hypothetical protein
MAQQQYDIKEVSERVAMLQRAGAPDEQIVSFLGKAGWTLDQYVQQVELLSRAGGEVPELGKAEGIANMVSQGGGFGLGDETDAALQALWQKIKGNPAAYPDIYRELQARFELQNAGFARDNPNTAALASGTGAALGTLPLLGTGGAGKAAAETAVGRIGASGFFGGAGGAVGAAGSAQPGERVDAAYEGALKGTALGAGLGAGAEMLGAVKPVLGDLYGYVMGVVRGRAPPSAAGAAPAAIPGGPLPMGGAPAGGPAGAPAQPPAMPPPPPPAPVPGTARARAVDVALKQLQRDGQTPLGVLGSMQEAHAAGAPTRLVDHLGPNGQGMAQGTVTLKGQGQRNAQAGLLPQSRPPAQRERIEGALEDVAGQPIPSPQDLAAQQAAQRGRRSADYRQAYAQGAIDDPTGTQGIPRLVEQLESRPIYRQAFEAENASRTRTGEALPPLFDDQGRVIRPPTVEDVDAIKKQLDAEVYGAEGILTPETARARAAVGRVEGARAELLRETDTRAPGYAATRQRAGSDFEQDRAGELASRIETLSSAEVERFLSNASQAAQQTFRSQALLRMREVLLRDSGRGKSPALVRSVWENGDGEREAVMRQLFGGDADAYAQFAQRMRLEQQMADTRGAIWGGSNTANKLANAGEMGGGAEMGMVAMDAVHGGTTGASVGLLARGAAARAARAQSGVWEGTRDEISRHVFLDSADQSADFLRLLERVRLEREAAMRGSVATSTASAALGATTQRRP